VTVGADAPTDATMLTLNVKTQACDDSRCLPPQTTTLRIALQIDPDAPKEARHPAVFEPVAAAVKASDVVEEKPAEPEKDAAAAWEQLRNDLQGKLQTATDQRAALNEVLDDLAQFAKTHEGAPEAAFALFNRGMLAMQMGNDEIAEQSLRRAADLTDDADLNAQIEAQLRRFAVRPGEQPPDFTIETLTGKEISPKDFHGKVVLLDFWATWCAPCIAELPNMEQAYKKHHEAGFEIVSISVDSAKQPLTNFLEKRSLPWIHALNGDAPRIESSPAAQYAVTSIPYTVLIGRDGKIAAVNLRGPALEDAVAKALAQPVDDSVPTGDQKEQGEDPEKSDSENDE
jgi:peroxiredoxin